MMHYRKGENIEKQLTKEELPFEDFLPKDLNFLWMHVNGGTKVNNVLTFAKKALDNGEHKHVVWSGNGGGVVKTISCAEILKRTHPMYQVTRTCYTEVEEHWKPLMEGLEEIVANRQIPSLHIFMSLEPIDDEVRGLQKPNTKTDFWDTDSSTNPRPSTSSNNNNKNQRPRNGNPGQQRRPNYNQNKNQSQQQPQQQQQQQQHRNPLNNEDENNPQRNTNTKPRRRKPYQNQDRATTQNQPPREGNSNRGEAMES